MQGEGRGNGSKDRKVLNLIQIPGSVMKDLAHPCREEVGSQAKILLRIKRAWRNIVRSARKEASIVNIGQSSEGTRSFDSRMWWWRHSKMPLPV